LRRAVTATLYQAITQACTQIILGKMSSENQNKCEGEWRWLQCELWFENEKKRLGKSEEAVILHLSLNFDSYSTSQQSSRLTKARSSQKKER